MSGDALMMCEWADDSRAADHAYHLAWAGLEEREIEVILAYLADPKHRFKEDDDTGYTKTPAELVEYYRDRFVDEYASWEGIAHEWIGTMTHPESARAVVNKLFAAADAHLQSALHEVFDDLGASLSRESEDEYWWYEPGTGDGSVFCLKRPYYDA